jgi:hypothetical protein
MSAYIQARHSRRPTSPILAPRYQSSKKMPLVIVLVYLALMVFLLFLLSGCSGPSHHRLPAHFESETHASEVIQGKRLSHSPNRLPIAMALILSAGSSHVPLGINDDTWPQFAARVNQKVQGLIPVSMQEVVRLDEIPSGERMALLNDFKGMGEKTKIEAVLVVLPSSQEVKGPAQFDVLPEVGTLNGHQTENHATVELGLLDLKSGRLLLQSQGSSYATLEQLDTQLASNRYPRVRGSAMTSPIYPEEGKALATLRMVALNEALDQAVMKLAGKWHDSQGGSTHTESSQVGSAS